MLAACFLVERLQREESATLYHCDLSYCQLDCAACAALGDGLRDNHSLYGFHVVGRMERFGWTNTFNGGETEKLNEFYNLSKLVWFFQHVDTQLV